MNRNPRGFRRVWGCSYPWFSQVGLEVVSAGVSRPLPLPPGTGHRSEPRVSLLRAHREEGVFDMRSFRIGVNDCPALCCVSRTRVSGAGVVYIALLQCRTEL